MMVLVDVSGGDVVVAIVSFCVSVVCGSNHHSLYKIQYHVTIFKVIFN